MSDVYVRPLTFEISVLSVVYAGIYRCVLKCALFQCIIKINVMRRMDKPFLKSFDHTTDHNDVDNYPP